MMDMLQNQVGLIGHQIQKVLYELQYDVDLKTSSLNLLPVHPLYGYNFYWIFKEKEKPK